MEAGAAEFKEENEMEEKEETRRGVELRVVLPRPRLAAAWGEYEEKSAEWSELFMDLVMVANSKTLSDALKEDLSYAGLRTFALLFLTMISGWYRQTLWTARFSDPSLVYLASSYGFFVGLAAMGTVSAPTRVFFQAAVVQRVALIAQMLIPMWHIPSARPHLAFDVAVTALGAWILAVGPYSSFDAETVLLACLVVEFAITQALTWVIFRRFQTHATPLNLDHFSERMGCMVLVVLGESVVSAVISTDDDVVDDDKGAAGQWTTSPVYVNLALTLLVTFSVAIFYFAISPTRELHACRHSIARGLAYSDAHFLLFTALLALGTGVKFVTKEAVLNDTAVEPAATKLLFYSLAVAHFAMLLIRLAHFWGYEPKPDDPPKIRRTKSIWWFIIILSPVTPLLGHAWLNRHYHGAIPPIPVILAAAASMLVYTVFEHFVMHFLTHHGHAKLQGPLERRRPFVPSALTATAASSYGTLPTTDGADHVEKFDRDPPRP